MTITQQLVPQQTLPYGDRAFVDENRHLTNDAYQYINRLAQGMVGSLNNITTVIETTNTITTDLSSITTQLAVLQAEIIALQTQVGFIGYPDEGVPAGPPPPGIMAPQAFGLAFFFA